MPRLPGVLINLDCPSVSCKGQRTHYKFPYVMMRLFLCASLWQTRSVDILPASSDVSASSLLGLPSLHFRARLLRGTGTGARVPKLVFCPCLLSFISPPKPRPKASWYAGFATGEGDGRRGVFVYPILHAFLFRTPCDSAGMHSVPASC